MEQRSAVSTACMFTTDVLETPILILSIIPKPNEHDFKTNILLAHTLYHTSFF